MIPSASANGTPRIQAAVPCTVPAIVAMTTAPIA